MSQRQHRFTLNGGLLMANVGEACPLLHAKSVDGETDEILKKEADAERIQPAAPASLQHPHEWVAEGVPCSNRHLVEDHFGGRPWNSSIFACLGRNDKFRSSDLEVCLLGSLFPCLLYGSNVERLRGNPDAFINHCLPYTGLYLLGHSLFGWNCLAPLFSYPTRTAIRRKFNIEGSCGACVRSCGCCCQGFIEDEEQQEHWETACDFATHFVCHLCSLCQEARELRRQLPHPGFNNKLFVMVPPSEQNMGRGT